MRTADDWEAPTVNGVEPINSIGADGVQRTCVRNDEFQVVRIEVEEFPIEEPPKTWPSIVRAIGFVQLLLLSLLVARGCR